MPWSLFWQSLAQVLIALVILPIPASFFVWAVFGRKK